MAEGGKVVGRAAEGIIAKGVKDLLRVVAKDVEKDASQDVAKSLEKDLGKDLAKDATKDLGKDFGRDAGRDAGRDLDKELDDLVTCGDPVDVATGHVVLRQVDVELAGVLPLVLARTHVSSYRWGRLFGPTWSSTLDQRLEVDAASVRYLADDGLVLYYPRPEPGESVLPESGPRWPLARADDGGYTVAYPERGQTLRFARVTRTEGSTATEGMARPLVSIGDRNGNRIDVEHDASGTVTGVRHSGGYRIAVDTTGGLVTALRLPDTAGGDGVPLVRFGYDDQARLVEVTNSSGLPLRFTYDDEGRLTGWQDRNGTEYGYAYDESGRCVRTTGSNGFLTGTFDYADGMTVATNSLGHATTFHLNDEGRVVREVDPLGHATASTWDRDRPVSRTDPLGRTTRYSYDHAGNLVALTRPDGRQARAEYDELGLPVLLAAADGATWRREYDARGNLVAAVDPDGAITRYGYDENGALTSVTDALGAVRRIASDAAGLPVSVIDPLGATTRLTRDAFGRMVAVTDPLGNTTTFGWTVEGRLAWRRSPDGATERWVYDGEGNLIEQTDAAGQVTRMEVTHFDLPSARTGPDGARLAFGYDTELRLTSVTNPQGLVWHYEYDPAGRLVRETDFNGRVLTYAHDGAGQLVQRVNGAGESVRFTRDALGNVVEQRAGDAVTTFGYDRAGRLVRAAGPDCEVTFTRDPLGRVLAEACDGRTVTSRYDELGRRVRRRTPSGAESAWEYDANSRPTALTTGGQVLRFGHDPAGREVARRVGVELLLTQTWDPNHQLRSQTLTVGGLDAAAPPAARQSRLLRHRAYTYRGDGYLTGVEDSLTGPRRLDLDAAGRVTAVHGATWSEHYAYDAAGNLTQATWPVAPGGSPNIDALGDREFAGTLIRRAGGVHYDHDAQGRLTQRRHRTLSGQVRTWRYSWDAQDRMTGVTTPDGTQWRYVYDPLGRRVAKQRLGPDGVRVVERVDFTWDGVVLAEQAHTGWQAGGPFGRVIAWDFEPGGFRPVTQTERAPLRDAPQEWVDQRFYAIVTDLVGTPTDLVDPAGTLAWQSRTTLWGAPLGGGAVATDCPLRFPGQYHDPETGLNYNYFRYYDPTTARYGSSDPFGLAPAPNPHAYVRNPEFWIDPLGLTPCTEPGRRRAFRDAKRDAGIPMSQDPDAVTRVPMTDRDGNWILDENKQPIMTREYTYTRPDGSRIVIQDHAAGHQFGEGGVGDQESHFNVRPSENTRTGHVPGTQEHYPFTLRR